MGKFINCISLIRIPIAISMLFNYHNKSILFVLLMVSALSDILDGYLARKFNLTSKTGAKIDTIADFFMFIAITYILILDLYNNTYLVYAITFILILKAIVLLVCFIKYRELSFRHTVLNKLTGLMFVIITIIYFITLNHYYYIIVISLASLATIEEIIINLISRELDLDLKSIFILKK